MSPRRRDLLRLLREQRGFTMIIALGVMFVTSLLIVAAFTVANGEVASTRTDTFQKQAYYAALAGVQEYEYKLQANPSYWETCEGLNSTELPDENSQLYKVEVLPASTAPANGKGEKVCQASKPFETVIESKGNWANTFRIKSVGTAGSESRALIATFKVSGFLDFVYYTNFETEDPGLYNAPAGCAGKHYKEWHPLSLGCQVITFANKDEVNGPMHTNDSTRLEGIAYFGRKEQKEKGLPDTVEILGATYPEDEGENCKSGEALFYTTSGCYTTKGREIVPPESDSSLAAYVNEEDEFEGLTELTLDGSANTISVVNYNAKDEPESETIPWPENGLIFVRSRGCSYTTHGYGLDYPEELKEEYNCGTVYVHGTYSKSLTVAGENDLVVNGNLTPYGITLGNFPTGTATLGLIASEYVRVYHPVKQTYTVSGTTCSSSHDTYLGSKTCEYQNEEAGCDAPNLTASEDPNGWGTNSEPWIYGAILSTSHSFFVDNWRCGAPLKNLNVFGAIAQDYRGIVAILGSHGYIKNYEYDSRLATDEPPYFLAPLKSGWKVIRETAPSPG